MKLTQLSALSAAILLATSAQANSFAEDSSLNLELRNFFHERAKDNGADDTSASQWAQGIRLDYSSGYFENIVGVDLSAYYSLKLGASHISDGDSNPGLLRGAEDGDSESYGKTAYAIKFNLADMGVAKYGRMFLDTTLVNNSDSRVLPSLSEAFYADVSVEGLSLYGVYAKKSNGKLESGFDDYMYDGDSEAVSAVGGSYDLGNGLSLSADYATQSNVAKRYYAEASYSTEVEGYGLGLAAQYGNNSLSGDSKPDDGDDSQYAYGLKADLSVGAASFGLAYTKVESTDIAAGGGAYNYSWGMVGDDTDDTGYFGYNAVQYSDFNANGQKAWGFSAGYDFAGMVDGLSASAKYVTGETDPKDAKGTDEKEYNIKLTYAFPQLEGLSAQLRYAKNTAEDGGEDGDDFVTTDTRFIVKYNVAIF